MASIRRRLRGQWGDYEGKVVTSRASQQRMNCGNQRRSWAQFSRNNRSDIQRWMAVGHILGLSSGASGNWHRWFPNLTSRACCEPCGNHKAAFLIAVSSLIDLNQLWEVWEVYAEPIQNQPRIWAP
ncbi:sugar transporter [Castilleja foliolosa]|uniref:Sugar transporter n=1 Tax=Castilleja foliolosa TaxID=1961234 RepID=A0ABD3BVY3_9LAMI